MVWLQNCFLIIKGFTQPTNNVWLSRWLFIALRLKSQMAGNLVPIAVVIFDVVKMITFGQDFSLSICVSSAFTTWSCTREEYSVNISQERIHDQGKKKVGRKLYSNGVWRFRARYGSLSGSSKAFNFIYNIYTYHIYDWGFKYTACSKSSTLFSQALGSTL